MKRAILLVAVATVLLVVAPPPSPVHTSYVTSGSMAPSLETGDAFLVVDAGAATEGDIVVFDAETREGYTTHRVVGETTEGLITRGDANPTTDQAGGEPPVSGDQVFGIVPTIGGQPIAMPMVGTVVAAVGGLNLPAVGGGLVLLWGVIHSRQSLPKRSTVTARSLVVTAAIGLLLVGGLTVALAPSTDQVTYTAVEFDSPAPDAAPVGEPTTDELTLDVRESALTYVVIDADGADATVLERDGSTRRIQLAIPAREDPGHFEVSITVAPYPNTLPASTIESMHAVHPVVAVGGTVGVVFLPFALLYWLLIDGRVLLRAPLSRRFRSWGGRR